MLRHEGPSDGNTSVLLLQGMQGSTSPDAALAAPGGGSSQVEISQKSAPSPSKPKHSPRTGLLLFACSTVFVTLMGTQAKLLSMQHLPVFEIVFARSFLVLVMSSATVYKSGVKPLGNRRWLLLLRGFTGFCSVTCIYWAVSLLPLGDATALSFLAPLVVAFASPILLHEKLSMWHLVSLPVCLGGVIMVAQPSAIFPNKSSTASIGVLGLLVGCGQAVFTAGSKMCVRALRTTDEDEVIMLYTAVICTVGSGLLSAAMPAQHWRAPTSALGWLMLIAGVGLAAYGNQYCFTAGMRWSPSATSAMSLSYLSMVWALLLGLTVFKERPGGLELGGCALIVASTLSASLMDSWAAKRKKKKAADAAAAASQIEMSAKLGQTQLHVDDGVEDTRPLLQHDSLDMDALAQQIHQTPPDASWQVHTQQDASGGEHLWQPTQQTTDGALPSWQGHAGTHQEGRLLQLRTSGMDSSTRLTQQV